MSNGNSGPPTIYDRHDVEVTTKPCRITHSSELMHGFQSDPEDTKLLKRWIESGDYDTTRYTEMPHLHKSDKTRNIILHDNQLHMYVVLNGGRLRSTSSDGKRIESVPATANSYNQNVISTVITEVGEKVTYHDSSPLGGYYPGSFVEKIRTTQRVAARLLSGLMSGRDAIVVVPIFTSAITYRTDVSGETDFAAGTYRIPAKATMSPEGELEPKECELLPYLYAIESSPLIAIIGNYIADGALVALGFTHPQNHLGNRYLQVDYDVANGKPSFTGVLTDMEDVTDISKHPTESQYTKSEIMGSNSTDFKLSPRGKAIAHMLARAIDCDISHFISRLKTYAVVDPVASANALIQKVLDPAISAFQLGYKLAANEASREHLDGIPLKKPLKDRDIGMMMNGNRVSIHIEIQRLFILVNRYLRVAHSSATKQDDLLSIIDDEITAVTRMIGAIAAKDIVTTLNTNMVMDDRFIQGTRITQTLHTPVVEERKPARKRHRKRH